MCGIFCYLSKNNNEKYTDSYLYEMAMKIKHRGPDNTKQTALIERLDNEIKLIKF